MASVTISVILLYLAFLHSITAYYGDIFNNEYHIPSLNLGTSVAVEDTIYIFGGIESNYVNTRYFDITTLKFDAGQNAMTNTIPNNTALLSRDLCHGYYLQDGKTIVAVNVQYPTFNKTDVLGNTTQLRTAGISFYDIPTNTWTESQNNSILPPLRSGFMSAMSPENDAIYVMGGFYVMEPTASYERIHRYDIKNTSSVVDLTSINPSLKLSTVGGSSQMLPNGIIVIAFGLVSTQNRTLVDTSTVTLFDTRKNQIYTQTVSGIPPKSRHAAGSTLGPDKSTIYYFGGGDQVSALNPTTGNAIPGLVALDTTTWTWNYPKISGFASIPYVHSSLVLFNGTKLISTIGLVGSLYNNGIGVIRNVPQTSSELQDSKMEWFTNNPEFDQQSERTPINLSDGAISGITIAVIVVVIVVLVILWRRVPRVKAIGAYIQNEIIWNPRSGEPLWAETARLLVRFILLFLFLAFVVYSIYRSIESPVAIQEIRKPIRTVRSPDIRFCYEGFDDEDSPIKLNVFCAFRNGTDCTDQIVKLDMSMHTPMYPAQFGTVTCFMFISSPSYSFIDDKMGYSQTTGTKMLFSFQGPPRRNAAGVSDGSGAIHVDMYPPDYNPNMVVYNLSSGTTKLSLPYVREWELSEQGDNWVGNAYLEPTVRTTIAYDIVEYKALRQDDGWNYIGFSSTYDESSHIDLFTDDFSQNLDLLNTSTILAQLTVQPRSFTININNEQKVFPLLNAFAQVGGVLGLFIALQTLLFGFRPQSPWGIVHRWSFGRLRIKLTDRLADYFDRMGTPVPLVNPVSNRLSTIFKGSTNTPSSGYPYAVEEAMHQENRVQQVEERLQLMELLLKSYYLNDEVFRSLDQAVKRGNDERRRTSMGGIIKRKSTDSVLAGAESNEVIELTHHNNKAMDAESGSTTSVNRRPSGTVFPSQTQQEQPSHQRGFYQPRLSPDNLNPYDS